MKKLLALALLVFTAGGAQAEGDYVYDPGSVTITTPCPATIEPPKLTADLYLSRKITAQEERIDAQEKQIAQLKWSVDKLKLQVEGLKRAAQHNAKRLTDVEAK